MISYIRLAQLVVAIIGIIVADLCYSQSEYQALGYWLGITVIVIAAIRLVPPIIFPALSVQHNVAKMKHALEDSTIKVYPLTQGRFRYYRDRYCRASMHEPFSVTLSYGNQIILTRLPDKQTAVVPEQG